ncbi:MAG: hypothetical protein ACLQVY_10040 [Limisphaerales bacterium]
MGKTLASARCRWISTAAVVGIFVGQLAGAETNFFPVLVCSNFTYTNATIETVTPATVTVWWSGGGERVSMTNLPVELQRRFNYDPDAADEYLCGEAAKKAEMQRQFAQEQAAIAAAKRKLGPPQRIRVIGIISGDLVQIELGGRTATAYIHNLPPEVVAFVDDIQATRGRIAALTADVNRGGAFKGWPDFGIDRDALGASSAALAGARRHLRELQMGLESRISVLACPSEFFPRVNARQWEFQAMATPGVMGP